MYGPVRTLGFKLIHRCPRRCEIFPHRSSDNGMLLVFSYRKSCDVSTVNHIPLTMISRIGNLQYLSIIIWNNTTYHPRNSKHVLFCGVSYWGFLGLLTIDIHPARPYLSPGPRDSCMASWWLGFCSSGLKMVEPQRCLTKTWGLDGQSHHSTWKKWAHFF